MNHIVKEYEQDFSGSCAEITVLCGKLKQCSGSEATALLVQQLEQHYNDAQETLEQMELEAPNLEPGAREKVNGRIVSYKKELSRLKSVYKGCRTEAEERTARIELFSLNTDYPDTKETDMLMENVDIIESSGQQLEAGRRLLQETEDIGASVLQDLGSQREVLERSRGRLRDVETGLGESGAVLNKMVFRAQQNKLVLLLVVIGIIIIAIVGLYYLIF